MKLARWLRLTTLTALGLGLSLTSTWQTALATNFSSTEVDQSRYVLVATAGGSRLTILEQISSSRSCWQDNGSDVQVLLLNFDFTGICGRYSDLNGYSVRAAGEDLGSNYRLQVRTEGNTMALYATPRQGGTSLEVGRTRSLPNQFGRIYLNPGWRITRRVYNGQTLGHVYLTNDQTAATLIANAGSRPSTGTSVVVQPSTGTSVVVQPSTGSGTVPVVDRPSPGSGSTIITVPDPDAPRRTPRYRRNRTTQDTATTPTPSTTPTANQPIVIPVPQPATSTRPSTGTGSSTSGTALSGSPLPPPPSLSGSGANVAVVPVPVLPPTPTGDRPPGDSMVPVVPVTRDIVFGETPTYGGSPQPASRRAADLGFGYRLIVSDSSPDTQRRVRSLVPDAFRTVIDGQVVMQAGLFYNESEASSLLQRLSQENLPARLVPVN